MDVIGGREKWSVEQGDCLAWLAGLPEACVDLCVFSPPYEKARLYLENGEDLGIARDTEQWVAWMADVIKAALRITKGLVVCVCEGQTRNYRYSCGPALLMADLHRAGVCLRKPPIYRRIGIPGSGGPDWWRNDWEWCVCATNGGRLPWSDNTATGHPPKWGPGGEMSHRVADGARVNQWGHSIKSGATVVAKDGVVRSKGKRPSHRVAKMTASSDHKDGDTETQEGYDPPVLANPGNVVQQTYTASEVAALLGKPTDVLDCDVGGGLMGSDLAHDNEAPFPESLVEPFVRCFAPEGGIVCDIFSGSGTTAAVSRKWGRRFIGCDLRESQVQLSRRRLEEKATMFDGIEETQSTTEGA